MGNKIANKITEVSKNSHENNSEIVINEHDKEIHTERYYISRKKTKNYWWFKIKIMV